MRSKNVLKFPLKEKPRKTIISKIRAFFASSEGRSTSQWMVGTAAIGTLCVVYLPQTIFFDEYLEYILDRSKTDLTPKDVSDELNERIKTAALKVQVKPTQTKYLRSFTVSGFDIREFGTVSSSYGGWVGVPANYFYKSANDIDKTKLLINNEPINWNENSGQVLQDSLVLTESEQIFAFCRSILELKSYRVILNTLIGTGSVIATYALGIFVNEKYKMFKRPYYIRYAAYPFVYLVGYGLFGCISDLYTFQREKSIDKKLANMGPDMIEAGISFYTKLINKNNAIRELTGEEADARWFGFRTTPIEKRKKFLEAKLTGTRREPEQVPVGNNVARNQHATLP